MTKSEFEQITTSFGIQHEMRGFSVVLAAYTGPSYSDFVAIYNHNNTAIVNGYEKKHIKLPVLLNLLSL